MEPNYQPSLTTPLPRELTRNVVVSSYDALIDATSLLDDFRISYRVDYMEVDQKTDDDPPEQWRITVFLPV